MAKLVIKRSQLPAYLRGRFTASQLSKIGGVTTQAAYRILEGKNLPSFNTLNALGIQVLYDTTKAAEASK